MSLSTAAEALLEAWRVWYDSACPCPSADVVESVEALRRAAEAEDSCSYDEAEDDLDLTLGNFLVAQMAADRHRDDGWVTRQRLADEGHVLGPGDLEETIVSSEPDSPLRRHQYYALAVRYRRLLEQMIEMFGGTDRVWQHLRHLQECRRHGRPPGPLPPVVDAEQLRQAAAQAAWSTLTMGFA